MQRAVFFPNMSLIFSLTSNPATAFLRLSSEHLTVNQKETNQNRLNKKIDIFCTDNLSVKKSAKGSLKFEKIENTKKLRKLSVLCYYNKGLSPVSINSYNAKIIANQAILCD